MTLPGGVVVVKIGGNIDIEPVLDDIAGLRRDGVSVVLIHGGGPAIDQLTRDLGVQNRIVTSPDGTRSRRTDKATLDALTMALLGRVKPAIVDGLRVRGIDAIGLCAADGGMVQAKRRDAIRSLEGGRTHLVRDDRSGVITAVRTNLVSAVLAMDAIPVISPPAAALDEPGLVNVDADRVASGIATSLGAEALLLLSDVPGILAELDNPGSLRSEVGATEMQLVHGRMRHKVRAAIAAAASVPKVMIASGVGPEPVQAALCGRGTRVKAEHSQAQGTC